MGRGDRRNSLKMMRKTNRKKKKLREQRKAKPNKQG